MAEKGPDLMPAPLIHLLLTRRGPLWRVRILSDGTIRWKSYRTTDYPTPEAVARRCAAGLLAIASAGPDVPEDHPRHLQGRDVSSQHNRAHAKGEGPRHDADGPPGDGPCEVIHPPLRVRWECWGMLNSAQARCGKLKN